jgi:hypothetical protein
LDPKGDHRKLGADEAQKTPFAATESISVHPISAGRSSDYC